MTDKEKGTISIDISGANYSDLMEVLAQYIAKDTRIEHLIEDGARKNASDALEKELNEALGKDIARGIHEEVASIATNMDGYVSNFLKEQVNPDGSIVRYSGLSAPKAMTRAEQLVRKAMTDVAREVVRKEIFDNLSLDLRQGIHAAVTAEIVSHVRNHMPYNIENVIADILDVVRAQPLHR